MSRPKTNVIHLFGPSCCGKTSFAHALEKLLKGHGYDVIVVDDDLAKFVPDDSWRFIIVDSIADKQRTSEIRFEHPCGMDDLASALLGFAAANGMDSYGGEPPRKQEGGAS